jgi:hypothetical protein
MKHVQSNLCLNNDHLSTLTSFQKLIVTFKNQLLNNGHFLSPKGGCFTQVSVHNMQRNYKLK